MSDHKDKQVIFSVQLNWIGDTIGLLTSKKIPESLQVAAPLEFGGTEKLWTPEHFFLNAISGCFMTTYLAIATKMGFGISDLNGQAVGQIESVEGKYKFTRIDLFFKIYVNDENLREKAEKAMKTAHKYCLIANSVNAEVIYHNQVLVKGEQIDAELILRIMKITEQHITTHRQTGNPIAIIDQGNDLRLNSNVASNQATPGHRNIPIS